MACSAAVHISGACLHCSFTNVREQLAVNGQAFGKPPTLTSAVISLGLTLRVETIILAAPLPRMTLPSETFHLYVGFDGTPPP